MEFFSKSHRQIQDTIDFQVILLGVVFFFFFNAVIQVDKFRCRTVVFMSLLGKVMTVCDSV